MPSAKKRAVKKAASEAQGEEEHGEGYMALEEPEGAAASRRQGVASPSQPAPAKGTTYEQGSRVMFIGNLPHGFYERQLLGFFTQFGKVTRVRLSRNKKSGKAKHYAFLEFQHPEVAKIAAEALDGYFMFKQKLTCALMAPEKIHPQLFKGANRKFRAVPWRKLERQRHDKERSWDEHVKRVARIVKQDKKRQEKIRAAGMEYDYPALEGLPIQPKRILFASD